MEVIEIIYIIIFWVVVLVLHIAGGKVCKYLVNHRSRWVRTGGHIMCILLVITVVTTYISCREMGADSPDQQVQHLGKGLAALYMICAGIILSKMLKKQTHRKDGQRSLKINIISTWPMENLLPTKSNRYTGHCAHKKITKSMLLAQMRLSENEKNIENPRDGLRLISQVTLFQREC